MTDVEATLLRCERLSAGYGNKAVLTDVSVSVDAGQMAAVIGHNGAGKSTLLNAVFGLLPLWDGVVHVEGVPIQPHTPRVMLRAGVALVPQGNKVFDGLTVRENLDISAFSLGWATKLRQPRERVLELFPALRTRLGKRAGILSGGEKQMLALATALMLSPRMLLLDEPSLGLAPPLGRTMLAVLRRLVSDGIASVLIVEQKVRDVIEVADTVYVLREGHVVFTGPASILKEEAVLRSVYL